MQRSKQQALMFLLGAVLVGGVLGFSADRVMSRKPQRVSARMQMYNDLGIPQEQQVKMDSVLDDTNCKTADIMRAMRPAMVAVQDEGKKTLLELMTPAQREAYDVREKRFRQRADSAEKAREAQRGKDGKERPGNDRTRRCGFPPRLGPGGGPDGERRGPGGGPFM